MTNDHIPTLDCGHPDLEPDVGHSSREDGLDAVCRACCLECSAGPASGRDYSVVESLITGTVYDLNHAADRRAYDEELYGPDCEA